MKRLLASIESNLRRIFLRINSTTFVDENELSFYRVTFCLLFLLFFRPKYSWIGGIPNAFFFPKPLNIANAFSEFPSEIYFELTDYLIIIFLFLGMIGLFSKYAFIGLFLIISLNNAFAYSLNKIDHYVLVSLVFLVLAFTNSATQFAIRPEKKTWLHQFTLSTFGIFIVFGFFTAGLQKAYHWLDFDLGTSGTLRWIYDIYFPSTVKPIMSGLFIDAPPIILELMDYSGVLFELSGIFFLIYSKKSWKTYLVFASLFHLTNALILNIPFTFHFPIFGIWLLCSILFKYKILILLFGLSYFFNGIFFDIYLWSVTVCLSIFGIYFIPQPSLSRISE